MSVPRHKNALIGIAVVLTIAAPAAAQEPPHRPATEAQQLGSPGPSPRPRSGKPTAAVEPSRTGWVGSTLLPLAGVLGLAIVGGRLVRSAARRTGSLRSALGAGGRAPSGIMEILGRYPISRGATLVLLKLDSRVLLLSQSAGGRLGAGAHFSTLAEITDPEQVASILIKARDAEGDSLAERFRSMVSRFDRQMDSAGKDAAWEGSRSDIPVIDLTKRDAKPRRAPAQLRGRIAAQRGEAGGRP